MKLRYISLSLCVSLLLSLLCGCVYLGEHPTETIPDTFDASDAVIDASDATLQATDETTEATEATTLPVVSDNLADYVQPDIEETLTGTDEFGNSWNIPLSVPKLLPFSDDAIACQQKIVDTYHGQVESLVAQSEENIYPMTEGMHYYAYLTDGILSLVIESISPSNDHFYTVYNFDVTTGELLDDATFLKMLNITEEDFYTRAAAAAEAKLKETLSAATNLPEQMYEQVRVPTVSQENLDEAMPYLSDTGLMMAVNIYSLAGASLYAHLIPVP